MIIKNTALVLTITFFGCACLSAQSALTINLGPSNKTVRLAGVGEKKDTKPTLPVLLDDYRSTWVLEDSAATGKPDHAISYDREKKVIAEAWDLNHDGLMDSFYFYEQGVQVKQEIDSNFDGKIDIWVYLYKGNYMLAYERDKDFDGIVDLVKRFGP